MSTFWQLFEENEAERRAFSSLAVAWESGGEQINDNGMSRLTRCMVGDKYYYVKAYKKRGRRLRRRIGRSRVRAEWENVEIIASLGIPTLRLVAYGEENGPNGRHAGVMVTEEVPNVSDLGMLVETKQLEKHGKLRVAEMMEKLALLVRLMHQHKFVHRDLHCRNVLVSLGEKVEVYIMDCPAGRQITNPILAPYLNRTMLKDLACLNRVGKQAFTRTRRLKFYMRYAGLEKLDVEHKTRIRKILAFFKGRE